MFSIGQSPAQALRAACEVPEGRATSCARAPTCLDFLRGEAIAQAFQLTGTKNAVHSVTARPLNRAEALAYAAEQKSSFPANSTSEKLQLWNWIHQQLNTSSAKEIAGTSAEDLRWAHLRIVELDNDDLDMKTRLGIVEQYLKLRDIDETLELERQSALETGEAAAPIAEAKWSTREDVLRKMQNLRGQMWPALEKLEHHLPVPGGGASAQVEARLPRPRVEGSLGALDRRKMHDLSNGAVRSAGESLKGIRKSDFESPSLQVRYEFVDGKRVAYPPNWPASRPSQPAHTAPEIIRPKDPSNDQGTAGS